MHCNFSNITIRHRTRFKYLGSIVTGEKMTNKDRQYDNNRITKLDKLRNEHMRGSFKVTLITGKIQDNKTTMVWTWSTPHL